MTENLDVNHKPGSYNFICQLFFSYLSTNSTNVHLEAIVRILTCARATSRSAAACPFVSRGSSLSGSSVLARNHQVSISSRRRLGQSSDNCRDVLEDSSAAGCHSCGNFLPSHFCSFSHCSLTNLSLQCLLPRVVWWICLLLPVVVLHCFLPCLLISSDPLGIFLLFVSCFFPCLSSH